MSMNELNTTARDLMSVRAMIEELQAEAEALTDKLKAAMVEQGMEILQGDGWKASWKNVNSQRFDSKAFNPAHITPGSATDYPPIGLDQYRGILSRGKNTAIIRRG